MKPVTRCPRCGGSMLPDYAEKSIPLGCIHCAERVENPDVPARAETFEEELRHLGLSPKKWQRSKPR